MLQTAGRQRLLPLAALFLAEIVALALAYQFLATIDCRDTGALEGCRFLRSMVARALAVFAVAALVVLARPAVARAFLARAAVNPGARPWAMLHLAGVALLFLPLALAGGRDLSAIFGTAVAIWLPGAAAAAAGGLLWLAPTAAWREWVAGGQRAPLMALALALVIPDLADAVLPLWRWDALTELTFDAVALFLSLFSARVWTDPVALDIGLDRFAVNIAPQCSGVEGFALLTVFTLVYAFLFRREIRFPLFFLTVLPAGLAASWVLNIVRIGTLVLIGEHVSPEIAVNGFHSYAGWMFFTLLALALLYIVHAIPALHGGPGRVLAPPPPLERDWAAASILPFVAFMLSGVVAAALSRHPELAYPFRVLCMAAALWLFRRLYATLDWRPDPVALGAGLAVGVMWVALLPAAPAEGAGGLAAALAGLSAAALAVWIVLRIVGTVVLVPLIEELFFRGYILARLDRGGMAWRLLAIAVSTALFALLHGRWLAAGLAGVVFALVYLLRGRVGAAVQAHAAANALVAAWALARGDWTII